LIKKGQLTRQKPSFYLPYELAPNYYYFYSFFDKNYSSNYKKYYRLEYGHVKNPSIELSRNIEKALRLFLTRFLVPCPKSGGLFFEWKRNCPSGMRKLPVGKTFQIT